MRVCTKCKLEKPETEFNKDRNTYDGLAKWCKTCNRAKGKKYHSENREALSLQKAKHRMLNPELHRERRLSPTGRAKKKRARNKRRELLENRSRLTAQEWVWILEDWDYQCAYCSKPLDEQTATQDHVKPLSKGGLDTFLNVVPACVDCNLRKGVKEAIPGNPV